MDPPSRKVSRWYGWQQMIPLLSADVAFAAIWLGKGDTDAILSSLFWGPAVHLFAGPITHWAHGSFDKGALAFGVNLLLPASTMFLGLVAAEQRIVDDSIFIGFSTVAFLGAQTFDIVYLSHETIRIPLDSRKSSPKWGPSSIAVLPMLDPNIRGIMLTGQF